MELERWVDLFLEVELFFVDMERCVDFFITFGFFSEIVETSFVEMLDSSCLLPVELILIKEFTWLSGTVTI